MSEHCHASVFSLFICLSAVCSIILQLYLLTCYKLSCLLYKYESNAMSRMAPAGHITIMLSIYILIGFHKLPKLLLALLCQELTEEQKEEGCSFMGIYAACA